MSITSRVVGFLSSLGNRSSHKEEIKIGEAIQQEQTSGPTDKRTPEQCVNDRCAEYEKARARYTRPAISAQVQRHHRTGR